MNMRDPALENASPGTKTSADLREITDELVRTFVPGADELSDEDLADALTRQPSRPAGGGRVFTSANPPAERSSFHLVTAGHGWQRFFVEDLPEAPPAESRSDALETRQRSSAEEPIDPDHPVSDVEDERLLGRFAERLLQHSGVEIDGLELRVDDRQLFLRGEVSSRAMAALIEEVAEEVDGIESIDNRLEVRSTSN